MRWIIAPAYLVVSGVAIYTIGPTLGTEVFPSIDTGQFRMRLRAPDGTHIGKTEQLALQALNLLAEVAGMDNIELTVGYIGGIHSSYPVNAVYQWSRGPEEAIIRVGLRPGGGIGVEQLKEKMRSRMAEAMPQVRCSFEPADIINEVMSFGSPTPIEVSVNGMDLKASRAYMDKLRAELAAIPELRDLQFAQSLDYPTIDVTVDRVKAGLSGLTATDVARNLATLTSSTRFITPIFWADPKSGIGYQIQLEVPRTVLRDPRGIAAAGSVEDLKTLPLRGVEGGSTVLVRDVAEVSRATMPGQFDRYNMKRQIGLTANFTGTDLGTITQKVRQAIARAGDLPKDATLDVRGQTPIMEEMLGGLRLGLGLAVLVIFLLLAANFQSIPLSLATVSTAPAAIVGVLIALKLNHVTLNVQSFTGAIMAIGVAMANAILLVTFAERRRLAGDSPAAAAVAGAGSRLRPILMTSLAMIAGMAPMALAFGESGQQNAPLGMAVIGGLIAATLATLFILPAVFALMRLGAGRSTASLDPGDPASRYYDGSAAHEPRADHP
jgi:multidrug efflux pump subunit AcrB